MESTKESEVSESVIEGNAREIPFNVSSLPVPTQNYVVKAVMSVDEVKRQWQEYQQMEREVLQDDDYVWFVNWMVGDGKEVKAFQTKPEAEVHVKYLRTHYTPPIESKLTNRKKKSAFRKMQRFFGLSLPQIESLSVVDIKQLGKNHFVKIEKSEAATMVTWLDLDMRTIRTDTTVVVKAPSGATMIGTGTCSINERRRGRESFKNADHDVPATSWTRALNRAISDLVGWGEVSAEELEAPVETTRSAPATVDNTATIVGTLKPKPETEESSGTLKSLADLFAALNERGWQVADLMAVVGDLNEITNFDEALEKFADHKAKENE